MICNECGGEGKVEWECRYCSGTGEGMADGTKCSVCHGSGGGYAECGYCLGDGDTDCTDCKGKGCVECDYTGIGHGKEIA